MPADPRAAPETPRRRFLRDLVLAPAAVAAAAGCAGPKAAAAAAAAKPAGEAASPADDPYAALRAFPLPLDAEPAFVFRALPARDRE
jgi:hypothetical protein